MKQQSLHKKFPLKAVMASGLFVLLTACGGGGGGGGGGSDGGSSGGSYSVGGTVTGLKSGDVTLANNGSDELTVAGNTFEFPTSLSNGSNYEVTVSRQPDSQVCTFENGSGSGTVAGADVDNVAVRCRGWGTPEKISNPADGAVKSSTLADDGNGNAIAVWQHGGLDYGPDRAKLFASAYTASGGWSAPRQIDVQQGGADCEAASPGYCARRADVAAITFDSEGNAIVVFYQEIDGPLHTMFATTYTPGGSWSSPVPLSFAPNSTTGYTDGNPHGVVLASDDLGKTMVAWTQNGTSDTDFNKTYLMSRTFASGSWSGLQQVAVADKETGNYRVSFKSPRLAFDASGKAVIAWTKHFHDYTDWSKDSHEIWASGYNGAWGSATRLQTIPGTNSSGYPNGLSLSVSADGKAVVAWPFGYASNGSPIEFWATSYSPAAGWDSSAKRIEPNQTLGEFSWSSSLGALGAFWLHTDSGDQAVAVWTRESDNGVDLVTSRFTAGGGWGAEEQIGRAGSAPDPWHRSLYSSNNGRLLLTWTDTENADGGTHFWSRAYSPDSGWGEREHIATADTTFDKSNKLNGVLADSGDAMLLWNLQEWGNGAGWSNRYIPDTGWETSWLIASEKPLTTLVYAGSSPLFFDGNGDVVALWTGNQEGSGSVYHAWTNRFD